MHSGALLAFAGVLSFSFTFPVTAIALRGFGAWTVVGIRCVAAGLIAIVCLALVRAPLPSRRQWRGLAVVAGGCVFGFPILTTLALRTASSGHSAVVIGLLPLATAVVGAFRAGNRPRWTFWAAASVGAATVIAFTVQQSHGAPTVSDLLLFAALVVCALGYAEGGRLATQLPGWQVIAWALVASLPVTVPMAVLGLATEPVRWAPAAVASIAYIALISQIGGFGLWYRGMAAIGVARASQLQLAQPLLTLVWSVVLLHEQLPPAAPIAAVVVLACIVVTQRTTAPAPTPVHRR